MSPLSLVLAPVSASHLPDSPDPPNEIHATVRLGTNHHIMAARGNQVGGKGSHKQAERVRGLPVRTNKNTKLQHMCRGPRSGPTGSNMAHRINSLGLMGAFRNYSVITEITSCFHNNW